MLQKIAVKVQEAAHDKKKIAMLHYQVLIHAEELNGVNPEDFCKEIGVSNKYATEFRKMLGLARLMRELGVKIVHP